MRRRPAWWQFLLVASAVLTGAGAVLILTGPVALGAGLLVVAQPMNVFVAMRSRAASVKQLGAQHLPE